MGSSSSSMEGLISSSWPGEGDAGAGLTRKIRLHADKSSCAARILHVVTVQFPKTPFPPRPCSVFPAPPAPTVCPLLPHPPMDTRLRSPPLTPRIMWLPMMVSLHRSSPRPASTISTRASLSARDQLRGSRSSAAK